MNFFQTWINKLFKKGKEEEIYKRVVTDTYTRSNQALFDLNPGDPSGPFTKCMRTYLVDSILSNIEVTVEYHKVEKVMKGLPLFLSEDIFDEGFVLHEQTCHEIFMEEMEKFKRDNKGYSPTSIEYLEDNIKHFAMTSADDPRAYLQNHWASLKNLFKFQPLNEIKDYFGVKNGLYFGFVGSFITMLWPASLIGAFCWLFGVIFYNKYVINIFLFLKTSLRV